MLKSDQAACQFAPGSPASYSIKTNNKPQKQLRAGPARGLGFFYSSY